MMLKQFRLRYGSETADFGFYTLGMFLFLCKQDYSIGDGGASLLTYYSAAGT
jgi:hypothetical protein